MSERKPVASNAGPLIWLAKIGRLVLLQTLFGKIVVPKRVYEEVVSERKVVDSILIYRAVEDWWIEVSEERTEDAVVLARVSGVHLARLMLFF